MPAVFIGQPRDVGRGEGITSQTGMLRDGKRLGQTVGELHCGGNYTSV